MTRILIGGFFIPNGTWSVRGERFEWLMQLRPFDTFRYANQPVIDVLEEKKTFQLSRGGILTVWARNVDQSIEVVEVCAWFRDIVAAFVRKFRKVRQRWRSLWMAERCTSGRGIVIYAVGNAAINVMLLFSSESSASESNLIQCGGQFLSAKSST